MAVTSYFKFRNFIDSVSIGPFSKGLHDSAGTGDFIDDAEVFSLDNLEVDTDNSLVNRPAIVDLTYTVTAGGSTSGIKQLGTYLPDDGRRFLVIMTLGVVRLLDISTSATVADSAVGGLANASVIQYSNKLWVIPGPTDTTGNGGYFLASGGGTPTWTTVAAIPSGGGVALYKDRIWISAGVDSTSNTSRLYFSNLADPTTWSASNFFDVDSGNGQRLVDCLTFNNDIILFKEHSTYRFTYTSDPSKAVITAVSTNIGTPSAQCSVVYSNTNVYVMHDNSVYEFFNYTYTRISTVIDMSKVSDLSLYSDSYYGLSLYRDRLIARYYGKLYIYSLRTGTWSTWSTDRKFSRLSVIPTTDVGIDIAYMASATSDMDGHLFYMRDDRTTDVGTVGGETFTCSVVTKTYDFNSPDKYKKITRWGASISCTGNTTATVTIPNVATVPTWDAEALLLWSDSPADNTWGTAGDINLTTVVPSDKGAYAKKYYWFPRAFRCKRTFFTISMEVVPNSVGDSVVRLYGLMVDMKATAPAPERVN